MVKNLEGLCTLRLRIEEALDRLDRLESVPVCAVYRMQMLSEGR
jgi:hypothetical protein